MPFVPAPITPPESPLSCGVSITGLANCAAEKVVTSDNSVAKAATGAVKAVNSTISFAQDPLGFLAQKAQKASEELVSTALPALTKALEPNLSADWFLQMYAWTFGIAFLIFLLQLMGLFLRLAQNRVSTTDVMQVLFERVPMFIIGGVFGPAAAMILVRLMSALTETVIQTFLGTSVKNVGKELDTLVSTGDPTTMTGGSIVALVIYGALFLALLVVLAFMLVMLVTLYLSGVVFPLAWQWITSTTRSDRAMTVVRVWLGVLAAQPLTFLMLGAAIALATSTTLQQDLPGSTDAPKAFRQLVGALVAAVAMWMAALTPLILVKFAPILPTDGGSGGGGIGRGRSGRGGGGSSVSSSGSMAERSGSSSTSGSFESAPLGAGNGGGASITAALAGVGAMSRGGSAAESSGAADAGADQAQPGGAPGTDVNAADGAAAAAAGGASGATKSAASDGMYQGQHAATEAATASGSSGGGGGSSMSGDTAPAGTGEATAASGADSLVDGGPEPVPDSYGDESSTDTPSSGSSGGGISAVMDGLADEAIRGMDHQDDQGGTA